MRIFQQPLTNQIFKERSPVQFLQQRGEVVVKIERGQRIATMNPGSHQTHQQQQRIGIAVAGHLTIGKLHPVDNPIDPLAREAIFGDLFKRFQHQFFDCWQLLWIGPLQTGGKKVERLSSW